MNFISLLLLLFACVLISCSNEEAYKPPRPDYWGESDVDFNGESYKFLPYGFLSPFEKNTLSIKLDRRNSNDEMRESLNIFNIPPGIGTYNIATGILERQDPRIGSYLGTYLDDGDVAGDIFRYDTLFKNSTVEISSWDTITREVRGTFYINLTRDEKYVITPGFPDTILVRGSFFTKIIDL